MTNFNLIDRAKKEVPGFREEYEKMVDEDVIDEETGAHIVFSYIFIPIAKKSIEEKNVEVRDKVFDFIEEMAESKDHTVSEVCDFTVMEELYDEYPTDVLIPLLGKESKKSLSAISRYMKLTDE